MLASPGDGRRTTPENRNRGSRRRGWGRYGGRGLGIPSRRGTGPKIASQMAGFIRVVLLLEGSPGPSGPPEAALQLQAIEGQAQGVGSELRGIDGHRAEQMLQSLQQLGPHLHGEHPAGAGVLGSGGAGGHAMPCDRSDDRGRAAGGQGDVSGASPP